MGGSTMCPQGEATTTMTAQLVVGLARMAPQLAMVGFAFHDRRQAVVAALVVGLILWVGWALLNNAAVHGWDSDMRQVP
jgi:hypothetical protein